MNRKVIEACLHFFYMESLYLPLREEAFGLPFFSLLEEKKACLLACQPVSNRSNGVTCMWLSPNYIYIPPISVVGKKRTLRICSLLCSHLSLEAQKKESIHTHTHEPYSKTLSPLLRLPQLSLLRRSTLSCQYWLTDWTDYGSSFNLQFNFYLLFPPRSSGSPRALRESLKATSTTPFFHTFNAGTMTLEKPPPFLYVFIGQLPTNQPHSWQCYLKKKMEVTVALRKVGSLGIWSWIGLG